MTKLQAFNHTVTYRRRVALLPLVPLALAAAAYLVVARIFLG